MGVGVLGCHYTRPIVHAMIASADGCCKARLPGVRIHAATAWAMNDDRSRAACADADIQLYGMVGR